LLPQVAREIGVFCSLGTGCERCAGSLGRWVAGSLARWLAMAACGTSADQQGGAWPMRGGCRATPAASVAI